jgi:hypothetical protein
MSNEERDSDCRPHVDMLNGDVFMYVLGLHTH